MKVKLNNIIIIDSDDISNFLTSREIIRLNVSYNLKVFSKSEDGLNYLIDGCENRIFSCPELILLDKLYADVILTTLSKHNIERLKIVIISSFMRRDDCNNFSKMGAVTCIEKPIGEWKIE